MGAIAAKPLSASPRLTTDRVDEMYHQLVEIHPSPPHSLRSAPTGVGSTQTLTRFRPTPAGRGLL
jgi:hypothetical protein